MIYGRNVKNARSSEKVEGYLFPIVSWEPDYLMLIKPPSNLTSTVVPI